MSAPVPKERSRAKPSDIFFAGFAPRNAPALSERGSLVCPVKPNRSPEWSSGAYSSSSWHFRFRGSTEVLIVGAGPTGLVLALWLKRLGVDVRIIDKTR